MKWRRTYEGLEANVGPMRLLLTHNLYREGEGLDAWQARVRFADAEVRLYGGERFKTEEQARDAAVAWARELVASLTKDLEVD